MWEHVKSHPIKCKGVKKTKAMCREVTWQVLVAAFDARKHAKCALCGIRDNGTVTALK